MVSVDLAAVSPGGYFIYIVEFQPPGEKEGVGLRLIAHMDGTVVRPKIPVDIAANSGRSSPR